MKFTDYKSLWWKPLLACFVSVDSNYLLVFYFITIPMNVTWHMVYHPPIEHATGLHTHQPIGHNTWLSIYPTIEHNTWFFKSCMCVMSGPLRIMSKGEAGGLSRAVLYEGWWEGHQETLRRWESNQKLCLYRLA